MCVWRRGYFNDRLTFPPVPGVRALGLEGHQERKGRGTAGRERGGGGERGEGNGGRKLSGIGQNGLERSERHLHNGSSTNSYKADEEAC
ncbi:hypothetical protein AK812_SmicGene38041 [Symbiodinium microadriaticum]|uniref:Uncharacterized protein n=1 Tax=Symbiodinium microadriaticum TaxID=2951 RepID=A0A1Q9CEP4_SYMMI|nr:hypothetical protein AK812_SmicGene38041 [Symbiodinium microadriaticum]